MGIIETLKLQERRQGRLEGRKEGHLEGRLEKKRNIAREFKKLGVSIADIAKGTGLSPQEIEQL